MPTYLPAVRYGGPMFSVHALCRELVRLGHDVQVCTTSIDGADDLDVPLGTPVNMDGVEVWYFRADRLRRFAGSAAMGRWVRERVAHFDLVHTHTVFLWPIWNAARRARNQGVPYVMAPRGMLVAELIAKRNRLAKSLWLRLLEQTNLERADALHFTSELERVEAQRLGISARRAVIIPNGIDFAGIPPGDERGTYAALGPFALHLGRINWKKGLDRLILALVHAPNIRAVIAGNDEENCRVTLERLAHDCGVSDRVRFLNPVYGDEKWQLLRAARALVLPSHSENFGNAVLEAMAVGTPVIVSPGVGLAAAVRNAGCGMVVDPAPESLAQAMAQLWDNDALRRSMGACAQALVRSDYSWRQISNQVVELYGSILEARHADADRH